MAVIIVPPAAETMIPPSAGAAKLATLLAKLSWLCEDSVVGRMFSGSLDVTAPASS